MIHTNCLKKMCNVLRKYLNNDQIISIIDDLLIIKGTNSSFKLVFKELRDYVKNH